MATVHFSVPDEVKERFDRAPHGAQPTSSNPRSAATSRSASRRTGSPKSPQGSRDRAITVTACGRICMGRRKINLSIVFAGQNVGVNEVSDKIWLVSFMKYDLGFFDQEVGRVTSVENPFDAKVLPMCPE